MELFKHRGFLQKIIITIVFITLFNFICPNYMMIVSNAARTEESTESDDDGAFDNMGSFFSDAGGILLSPFVAFINFFADTASSALQSFMMHNAEAVMTDGIDDDIETSTEADVVIKKNYGPGTFYPNFIFSCEEIFANKVPMLDINFLKPSVKDFGENSVNEDHNIAKQLQNIIKAWYRVLRMIAIVGLLSVLIYIGIRIMIDSNSSNKAKYKEKLLDWIVAFVILFTMQYIMSFTLTMTEELSKLFTSENNDTRNIVVSYQGEKFKTNLIGLARFKVQNENFFSKVAYEIVYIALLVYTVKFTIVYLKRVINMAFLTLISPIVALMYPIQDGKAQAFGMWLKEYIFNALLQPLHYLLYTVLISSSISLAANNPLYAIVALAFMTQAEKFLKHIFGFGKASGGMVGGMSSFASAAIASHAIASMKKGGGFLGKEHGPQSELAQSRMPTTKKDTDIEGISNRMQLQSGDTPEMNLDRGEGTREKSQISPQERERAQREQEMRETQMEIEQSQDQMRNKADGKINQSQEEKAEYLDKQSRQNGGQQQDQNPDEQMEYINKQPKQNEGQQQDKDQEGIGTDYIDEEPRQKDQEPRQNGGQQQRQNQDESMEYVNRQLRQNEGQQQYRDQEGIGTDYIDEEPRQKDVYQPRNPASINLAESLGNKKNTATKRRNGAKRVLKNMVKPIWDTDKSAKENGKRWAKRYVQAGMGLMTAAVEMGASVTDGKFNIAESAASIYAGAKGAGIAWENSKKTKDNYVNAYRVGAYGNEQAAAMNYIKKWKDSDETNKFYKNNYGDDYKYYKEVASEELLTRGVKDYDEQKQCLKYAEAIKEEKYNEWEKNEKQVIRQEHKDYNEQQVNNEFNIRKSQQAEEIRNSLGKNGKKLTDEQAIQRGIMAESTKEAASIIKFRKKASNKGALINPTEKKEFTKQQVKALKAKPENANKSTKELQNYVNNAFNKVDKFDAINDI